MTPQIEEYIPGKIYIAEYPVHFGGMDILARMSLVKLRDGRLWAHNAAPLNEKLKQKIDQLGQVSYIIAPGTYHHLHVSDFQGHYPDAETFICPGLEKKITDMKFDWILGNRPDHRWQNEFEQVVVTGTRFISEVAFFHKPSRTLLLVDLLENYGDDYTHSADPLLQFWWKHIFHMWNNPKAAPEYQMGWGDRVAVKRALDRILDWDFERIILAHGNTIESNAKAIARKGWQKVLEA